MRIGRKIGFLLGGLGLLSAGLVLLGLTGMASSNRAMESMYSDRVVPMDQLKRVADAYSVDVVDAAHQVRNGNISREEGLKRLARAEESIGSNWKAYLATYLTPEEKRKILGVNLENIFKSVVL